MSKQDSLETIWEVPDDLWEEIEPLISPNPPMDGMRTAEGGEGTAGEMAWAPLG